MRYLLGPTFPGRPIAYGYELNPAVERRLAEHMRGDKPGRVVIEGVRGYGLAVGQETFDTCRLIGRFELIAEIQRGMWPPPAEGWSAEALPWMEIGRKEVKSYLCGAMTAKDRDVRAACIAAFGLKDQRKLDAPLTGISGDVWAALAVALTYHQKLLEDLRRNTKPALGVVDGGQ